MIFLISFIVIYFIPIINGSYNPIPYGSMIISTTRTISVLPLNDYTTTDKLTIIFTANKTETILYTMFDSKSRELYVLFLKATNNLVYISKLLSLDKLDPIQYEIPISGNLTDSNKLISFSSDINNKRIFLTDQYGNVTMYSMGGTMKTQLSIPSNIKNHIQSVNYNPIIDRLFILTDSTIDSCKNLDKNHLHCCNSSQILNQLRSITFEPLTMKTYAYVIDERTGIYEVKLNTSTYCPMSIRPLNTIDSYYNKHLIIYENLYISSASGDQSNHNSILIISNATQILRKISFDTSIVALHISYPNIKSIQTKEDSCFRGLTYHHYRIAMVLAAIFGTIMGNIYVF